ncbi:MAG: hypothetical protein ACRDF4_10870 [Rhabdochlamydiaceae bacterium]
MTTAALSSASSSADALIDCRVVPGTRHIYNGRIAAIEQFYKEHKLNFTLPLRGKDILAFFGWLINIKHLTKPLAFSSVRLYKSALMWYYKEKKVIMEPAVNQELETLLDGYKRQVADLKLGGKMPIFEGKYHLTFAGYYALAKSLFHSNEFSLMLFGWPYLLLQWNLIARSNTISSMMMEHIGWEADALLISMPKHKGDQEGAKCFARHVYANPSNPIICPVLALAILTFVRSIRHDPDSSSSSQSLPNFRVFDGSDSAGRFADLLRRIIAAVPPSDVHLLGGDKKQLGTHSIRKGAASFCAGMISGPSTVQIFLRAGWSLGNVQDRYIFAGAGGDQLTGRALSGLPFNSSSFASLPPHFDQEGTRLIEWNSILPLYSKLPDTFKQALPLLLASICYHEKWLRTNLPSHHPLFSTPLFSSGRIAALIPHVSVGCYLSPVTGLQATGIPPQIVMANDLLQVAANTQLLKEEVLSKYAELPAQVTNMLLSKLSINGAIPVTLDDMKTLINSAVAELKTQYSDAHTVETCVLASHADPNSDPRFQLWSWGGKFHMVPESWIFPSTNIKDTWNLWHFGHLTDKIRPLRCLKKMDLVGAAQTTKWSKTSGVVRAISQVMVEMKLVEKLEDVLKLSSIDSSTYFDQAIVQLMEKVRAGSTQERGRWMEASVHTLYALIHKAHKRKRSEEQADVVHNNDIL